MIKESELMEFYRLDYIRRYNTQRTIKNESVAAHSFFVALFALKICDKYCVKYKEKINDSLKLEVLTLAIIHDVPEFITNDITYDARKNMPEINFIIEAHENGIVEEYFPEHHLKWKDKKSLAWAIVKLADKFSVKQFAMNEVELGNSQFEDILFDVEEQISNLEEEFLSLLESEDRHAGK